MRDIRLVQSVDMSSIVPVTIDWLLKSNGQLDETQALASAVIVALGTDRRALESDILPDLDDTDLRGWWGDYEAFAIWDGWPIGTRLWLLGRTKIVGAGAREGATIARVESYVNEAMRPFIERGVASRVTVNAERIGLDRIDVRVVLYRGPTAAVDLRFAALWEDF